MPKGIVLHAGFHKTGTSTIQHHLRRHRAHLKPYLAFRLKPGMKPLLHACRGYSTWRDPLTLAKAEHRFAALLEELPGMPRRTLLLSGEELSGHMPGRGDLGDYSAAPILLARFAEIARTMFPKATLAIHLTTRAPQSWLRSAWAEHVVSSSMVLDFDAFAARYGAAADLDSIAAKIATATGVETHTHRIEEIAENPAAPILAGCGVPGDTIASLPAPPRANARPPDDVLLALLEANRAYPDRDARRRAKHAILAEAGL